MSTPTHHSLDLAPGQVPASPRPASASSASSMPRYRWAIASRALAATAGGYALSALFCASAGLALLHAGASRLDAVMTATMLAFVLQPIAAIWAFRARSTSRVWVGMAILAALLGVLALALGWKP